MNSRRFYHIWICLLCLFPAIVTAQTLTQYEYWFDDGFDNRITMGLSGKEKYVTAGLDTRSLGSGMHQFYLRLKQSDGMYSPITSQMFFKAMVNEGGSLEYWFDNDFSGRKTASLTGGASQEYISVSIDASQLSNGVHQFFYRLKQSDDVYSPVSVSHFFKAQVPQGGMLEYWFDDNHSGCKRIASHLAADGKAYVVNTTIDVNHLSAGYHRLYYRFVNEDGSVCSATSMTPVVIKGNYFQASDYATVTKYRVSVDGKNAQEYAIADPANEVEIEHSFNASELPNGWHQLNVTFWNSEQNSVTCESPFKVLVASHKLSTPNPETFRATDLTETGFTASWDAVPGALRYDILVKKENGGDYANADFNGGSSVPSVKIYGLQPGTSYLFQVRAKTDNWDERSDWSPSIPKAVKTVVSGTIPASLTIHSINGFDGTEPLIVGTSNQFKAWVKNEGDTSWEGSFYLKEGEKDIKGWYGKSLQPGWAMPLECDYTPESTGKKTLILYYQTGGKGGGIPVRQKGGVSDYNILVQVNEALSTPSYDLCLGGISCPSTLDRGETTSISATIVNQSKSKWSGNLYLTDNGLPFSTSYVTLKSGESYTLTNPSWSPRSDETHAISVLYKTDGEGEWEQVSANGFTLPVMLAVTNVDIPATATEATLTLITKDCAPTVINEGDQVFYHYRITDKNGKPLKGIKAQFACSGSSKKDMVETLPSDVEGYATLCLLTEGTDAFAERGQSCKFVCTGFVDGKNNPLKLLNDEAEDKEFTLKLHKKSIFENLESFALTIDVGASGNVNPPGNWVSASVGVSFPLKTSFSWNTDGDVTTEIEHTAQVEGEVDLDFMDFGIGGVWGGKYSTSYNWSLPGRTSLAMLLSIIGMESVFTKKETIRSIMAIEDWFGFKFDPEEYFKPILEHQKSSKFWSVSGKLSKTKSWKSDNPMRGTLFPELGVPQRVTQLKGGVEGVFMSEYDKEDKDFSTSKTLYGFSRSLKAKYTCDASSVFDDLSPAKPTILNPFPENSVLKPGGLYRRDYYQKLSGGIYLSMTSQEEEMFTTQEYKQLEKVSNSLKLDAGVKLSASTLANYLCENWMSANTPNGDAILSAYIAIGMGYKWKMSSKGAWAAHLQDLAKLPATKDIASKIYPAFSDQYVIDAPCNYYTRFIRDMENKKLLYALREASKVSGNYPVKDALKIEQQESEKMDLGISLPIAKWKVLGIGIDVTLDVGFSLDFTYYPSESYYSVADLRFFPVTLRQTSSLTTMAKSITSYLNNKIEAAFGKDDKEEICERAGKLMQWNESELRAGIRELSNKNKLHSTTNTYSAKKRAPLLTTIQQEDICTFTFNVNDEVQNFERGTMMRSSHFYPLGKLLGVTEQNDTLFVVSEVFDIAAVQGTDTLKTTQAGKMKLETYVGVDDLTPFGFSDSTPLDVYQADEGSNIWHYVGPAGTTLLVDKLGSYMMATSIKNDLVAPEIRAELNRNTGALHLHVSDNIAIKTRTLMVQVNGEIREVSMINEQNFEVQLSEEELNYMITLYVTVNDLAGNQGNLFQTFFIDKSDNIDIVKENEDQTMVRLSKDLLKVEGAQPDVRIMLFALNGTIMAQGQTDTYGRAQLHLNHLTSGVYIVTLSNGKSKKFVIK